MPNPEDIINMFFNNDNNNLRNFNFGGHTFNVPTDTSSFFANLNNNMFNNNFVRPLIHKVYVTLEDVYNNNKIHTTITRTIATNNNKTNVREEINVSVPSNILDSDTLI